MLNMPVPGHGKGFWSADHAPKARVERSADGLRYEVYPCYECGDYIDPLDPFSDAIAFSRYGRTHYRCVDCAEEAALWNVKNNVSSDVRQAFLEMCEAYNWTCPCCLTCTTELEMDHVKPRSWGGTDSLENIQPLCKPCNIRKSDRHATRYPKPEVRDDI